jgi:hypothetical protein
MSLREFVTYYVQFATKDHNIKTFTVDKIVRTIHYKYYSMTYNLVKKYWDFNQQHNGDFQEMVKHLPIKEC